MSRVSMDAVAARYEADAHESTAGSSAVQHRLARAVGAIGWRAASDVAAEDVATRLSSILGASIRGRRDLGTLRRDIAECLRRYAHPLDGSSASRAEWEPAAARILELYVNTGTEQEGRSAT